MTCPLETRETAEQLLDYCARKLEPQAVAVLERHIAICPACRQFADNQRTIWEALDAWEAEPVSSGFDSRLYRRIDDDVSWWERAIRPFRPFAQHWNVAASAAGVFVILTAGLLLNRPVAVPQAAREASQVEQVQPDQVEQAMDAMDTLAEFNRHVKATTDAKM